VRAKACADRHDHDVGVNVLRREGNVQILVVK
jgi:hypothetical protein